MTPRLSGHAKAQALRFARLTALALGAEYLRAGGNLPIGWPTLWVLLPGTAETLLREIVKVEAVPVVTAVPAPPGKGPAS